MIYVFKTSVKTKVQAKQLQPHFARLLPDAKWNFDLEDCDNILRVDSNENIVLPVISILNDHRFDCEELE